MCEFIVPFPFTIRLLAGLLETPRKGNYSPREDDLGISCSAGSQTEECENNANAWSLE